MSENETPKVYQSGTTDSALERRLYKTTEFWGGIATAITNIANAVFGSPIPEETMQQVNNLILALIIGRFGQKSVSSLRK